ncbi:MAG: FKBP-type peptidyl-prolyl cis-trans isomerase [Candidatus Latescibacteria bacterium]|nr:FKBP-type peptidyl-prolyl cis-trans isomerase [Candidatus Latescibacterota bacterium]
MSNEKGRAGKGPASPRIAVWAALLLSALFWACGDKESPTSQEQTPVTETALRDTVTASGLHFIDLVRGTGPAPHAGDVVETHYTGWLEDGTKFDSSLDRGEPLQFVLGRGYVIAGWDEGLALMRQGGKARLVIPPDLAYGARGAGGVIPPNATLTFEVELVRVR